MVNWKVAATYPYIREYDTLIARFNNTTNPAVRDSVRPQIQRHYTLLLRHGRGQGLTGSICPRTLSDGSTLPRPLSAYID